MRDLQNWVNKAMNQKFLIILMVISLSLAAFLGGYLISQNDFQKKPSNLNGSILEKFNAKTPIAASQDDHLKSLTIISRSKAVSPVSSKDNDGVRLF